MNYDLNTLAETLFSEPEKAKQLTEAINKILEDNERKNAEIEKARNQLGDSILNYVKALGLKDPVSEDPKYTPFFYALLANQLRPVEAKMQKTFLEMNNREKKNEAAPAKNPFIDKSTLPSGIPFPNSDANLSSLKNIFDPLYETKTSPADSSQTSSLGRPLSNEVSGKAISNKIGTPTPGTGGHLDNPPKTDPSIQVKREPKKGFLETNASHLTPPINSRPHFKSPFREGSLEDEIFWGELSNFLYNK